MIIVLAVVIAAAVAALICGGSLESLAATRFRLTWLIVAGLVLQLAVDLWLSQWLPAETATAGIVASNGAVAAFLLANHRLPGMALAGAGLVLNLLVIAANGAMPVSQRAARIAGLPRDALSQPGIKHEVLGNDTALSPLADVIPLPGTGQVISAGDIVLAAGIGRLVYARTRAGRKKQQETLDS